MELNPAQEFNMTSGYVVFAPVSTTKLMHTGIIPASLLCKVTHSCSMFLAGTFCRKVRGRR